MITNREKYLLWKALTFDINRYLMANSCQRLDGYEKAERHINISKIMAEFILMRSNLEVNELDIVHDYLAEILTNRMDEVIGFPINTPLYGNDYDPLARKFFEIIINNMQNIENLIGEHKDS
jgi:hypothetical protein